LNDERFSLIVKQVKEASDIVAVVGSYLQLKQAGPTFKGLCPFHNDNRPSFDVDPRRQRYRCWSCGKMGDVISFVMEYDKVSFMESFEALARRAGIDITQHRKAPDPGKSRLYDALKWAADLYQQHLLEDSTAESARAYLGDRKLLGETVRKFGLGWAPLDGDWLAKQAHKAPVPVEVLVEAGLLAPSTKGTGYYDRFRERVMFPIRDLRDRTVGFGGRILPTSSFASRAPKYYNTSETTVFKKGELVYGLDLARLAAQAAGYLAVVEGYTDVLMAHQMGVTNVVATLGTALTSEHIRQIRRFAPRVVLVYDADAGGTTGVDRALELFLREDLDLAIASLPDGLDPFDLLVKQGADPFRQALTTAKDVLDYKLDHLLNRDAERGVAADRRAVEAVLGILALTPDAASTDTKLRRELIVTRIARRFGLNEATLQERLTEMRRQRPVDYRTDDGEKPSGPTEEVVLAPQGDGQAKPDARERILVQCLLAEPELTATAKDAIPVEEIEHPGLRRIVHEMYDLLGDGIIPELDTLRVRLIDKPKLADFALRAQEVGLNHQDRSAWLVQIIAAFRERRMSRDKKDLRSQLQATGDSAAAMELLRKLQTMK
jgi:DNA primase